MSKVARTPKYFLTLLLTGYALQCFAGGYPVRPGRLTISPSFSYFVANTAWDRFGNEAPFQKNGQFTAMSYAVNIEYGISRRWSVNQLVSCGVNKYQQSDYKYPYSGFGDLETGIKYYLANINYKYYFSLQGTGIIPLSTNNALTYNEYGAELKLSFASAGSLGGSTNYYFNIDNAVRQYFGYAGPLQYRYSGAFGLILDSKFKNQISVSAGGYYSQSSDKTFIIANPINNRDFSFTQASLSYGHTFSKQVTMFLTGGHFITGRNTANGGSGTLALIYHINTR